MKKKSILTSLAVSAFALASALCAGRASAESATITYVESEPLTLQQNYQVGALVDFDLPDNYRIVVNDQPISVDPTVKKVSYKFEKPGDYVVVTQRRSGDTWVPVSEARTAVLSETSSSTSTTTTTTTSSPAGTIMKKTTTTTSEPTTESRTVTFYEDKPLPVSERYIVGEPIEIQIPDTVKTEYRFRINNEPVTYDVKTRRVNYTFGKAGDYEIVTERREGTTWTPVTTTKTVVVEK